MNSIMKPLKKLLAAVIVLGLGIFGFNFLVATKPDVPLRERAEAVSKVSATTVAIVDAQPLQVAFGEVTASRKINLHFSVGGEVVWISPKMQNGAIVRGAEPLARLDAELLELSLQDIQVQIAAETVNLEELTTQFELRERNHSRVSQMEVASVASEKALDDATLSLSISKNALMQSQSRLKRLKIALKRAQRNLRQTTLTPSFDGVLSDVAIGKGQLVSSAVKLGTVTDLSSLYVSFVVPSEVYAISDQMIGRSIDMVWVAGGRSVMEIKGIIKRAEGNVDALEGGGRFYASMPYIGVETSDLIPEGAFVRVTYPSNPLPMVAILPESAVFDGDTVFVIEDGRAHSRKVSVLNKVDGFVYVRGDLKDGDSVIITRILGLGEGALVEVVKP